MAQTTTAITSPTKRVWIFDGNMRVYEERVHDDIEIVERILHRPKLLVFDCDGILWRWTTATGAVFAVFIAFQTHRSIFGEEECPKNGVVQPTELNWVAARMLLDKGQFDTGELYPATSVLRDWPYGPAVLYLVDVTDTFNPRLVDYDMNQLANDWVRLFASDPPYLRLAIDLIRRIEHNEPLDATTFPPTYIATQFLREPYNYESYPQRSRINMTFFGTVAFLQQRRVWGGFNNSFLLKWFVKS